MNTQQNAQNILTKLFQETKLSGVDKYPVDISDLQDELKLSDVETKTAIELLVSKGLVSYRAVGNSMIELTDKGKSSAKK
jgi:Mn-dependent DtxR family transcriptional regulator